LAPAFFLRVPAPGVATFETRVSAAPHWGTSLGLCVRGARARSLCSLYSEAALKAKALCT
jgi:hypothetical protein